jgi:hypothetical protein
MPLSQQDSTRDMLPMRSFGPIGGWFAVAALLFYAVLFYWPGSERSQFLGLNLLLIDGFPSFLAARWTGVTGEGVLPEFAPGDRLPILLVTSLQVFVAILLGLASLHRIGLAKKLSRGETFFFSAAIGWQWMSLIYLALGCAGLAQWAGWGPILLAVPVLWFARRDRYWSTVGVSLDKKSGKKRRAPPQDESRPSVWASRVRSTLWLAVGVFYLAFAAVPPGEFDVREYHLQVPREWFQQGTIGLVEHNVYGNMPMGADIHGMGAMTFFGGPWGWWQGAIVGKVILACMTLMTAVGVASHLLRYSGRTAATIGAIVFLSTPWVFDTSTKGLVEGAFALYLFATLYAFQRAFDELDSGKHEGIWHEGIWRWIVLGGFLAGGAASIKYTAVVFVVIPVAVWIAFRFLRRPQLAAKLTIIFAISVGCSSGLWYAKNWLVCGNPVYPLLADTFGGESWNQEQNERWKLAHSPQPNGDGQRYSFGQWMASLKDVTFISHLLSPFLIPGALIGLVVGSRVPFVREWGAYVCTVFVLWWLATHRLDRFLVPLIPLLSILAAIGLNSIRHDAARKCLVGLLVIGCGVQWMQNLASPLGDPRILVSYDTLRNDPTFSRIHPAHAWLNRKLTPTETAILVGDAQPFDIRQPVYYNTCFDDTWLEKFVADKSPQETLDDLEQNRVRYIFVHWGELKRYRSPGNYGYSPIPTTELFDRLVEDGVLTRTHAVVDGYALATSTNEIFTVNW